MTITLAFGSGNGHILSHLGNRIDHFIGSNSLVVYYLSATHIIIVYDVYFLRMRVGGLNCGCKHKEVLSEGSTT